MSKLSPALKALIGAPFARPHPLPASSRIRSVYERLRREAAANDVGTPAWLTLSTAATITMNSPASLTELYHLATEGSQDLMQSVETAELMREVGLKCIGFNGIPRTINCLGAFRSSLPHEVASALATQPRRQVAHRSRAHTASPTNIDEIVARGHALWSSIYRPFDATLTSKLAAAHPDLPLFIVNHAYGALFADPPSRGAPVQIPVGRVLTSLVAVACLRAQTGVAPQVTSHVFGLRKAFADGSAPAEGLVQGGEWLASDEGSMWLLGAVDALVEALAEGTGSSFAPARDRAKL